jgi:serine phosphatase RsbU (regulator of sigma subunit)
MTTRRKRFIAVGIAALLLLVYLIGLPLRVIPANRRGSAGLHMLPGASMVVAISPGGAAAAAGLREGDRVAAIGGIDIRDAKPLQAQADRLKNGDVVRFLVERKSVDLPLDVTLRGPYTAPMAIVSVVVNAVVGLAFLVTGLFVFTRKPDDKRSLFFYLFCTTTFAMLAISEIGDWTNERGLTSVYSAEQVALAALLIVIIAGWMTSFLHFALIFPKDTPLARDHSRLLRGIYAAFLLAALSLAAAAVWWRPIAALFEYAWVSLFGLIGLLTAFWSLVRNYQASGPEEKRQIRWPLWATIFALITPFFVGMMLPVVYGFPLRGRATALPSLSNVLHAADIASSLLYLLIPISFAFAILKYRLMDIDLVIKKTLIYGGLTGMVIFAYLIVVGGIGGLLIRSARVQSQTVTIAFTLVVAVLFVPARNRVQGFVDRRFFRQKYDYPQALRVIGHEISQAADATRLCQMVADVTQQALRNRSVIVLVKEAHGNACVAVAKVGAPDEIVGRLRVNVHDAGGEIVVPGSALTVPATSKGQLVALFALGTKLSDEDFNVEEREFVAAVADQTALALDNLRMRGEEEDSAQAREIQQALLPRQVPQLDGCEICGIWLPARAVGGDYYDVLKFSDHCVALCIGDVAGKGVPAALLMSNLQATVKAIASAAVQPNALCAKVNQAISANVAGGRFITFFYGLVDLESKTLLYANAGHNPPILLHADGSAARLDKGGPVFTRLFRNSGYEQGEVSICAGDRIVLFTDGVTEARNADEEEFGEERLLALLSANAALRAGDLQGVILQSVNSFTNGELQDDLTLAVLSVEC